MACFAVRPLADGVSVEPEAEDVDPEHPLDAEDDAPDSPGESSAVCTAVAISGASDASLVDPGDASALFFHGDQDTTVPYPMAVTLHDAMEAAGLAVDRVWSDWHGRPFDAAEHPLMIIEACPQGA